MDLEIKKRPWIGGERGNSETLSVCLVWQWWELILIELSLRELILVKSRGVQNRTNPIEKPQTEPNQTETAFGSDVIKSFS